jgi:hypothetical protein
MSVKAGLQSVYAFIGMLAQFPLVIISGLCVGGGDIVFMCDV